MVRQRFVLRYLGQGSKPSADVDLVRGLDGVSVVEESARMLLVESEEEALPNLADALPQWVIGRDQVYEVPDTRKKITRPPERTDPPTEPSA